MTIDDPGKQKALDECEREIEFRISVAENHGVDRLDLVDLLTKKAQELLNAANKDPPPRAA